MMSITPAATPALKRSRSDLEAASTSSPQQGQPTPKRPRVQFKSENTVHTLPGWDDTKTPSLIKEEVKRALEKQIAGDKSALPSLGETLVPKEKNAPRLSSKVLKRYMLAITSLTSLVGRTGAAGKDFVQVILQIKWLGRDDEFVRIYQSLLSNLISMYGGYTTVVFQQLVTDFADLEPRHGRMTDEARVPMAKMLDRLHSCIQHLIQRIPACTHELKNCLSSEFPHTGDLLTAHLNYTKNMLRVATYAPYLLSDIIATLFDKVRRIDAELRLDIEAYDVELYNSTGEDLAEQISLIIAQEHAKNEAQEEEEGDFSESDDDVPPDPLEQFDLDGDELGKYNYINKQLIAKLDALMITLFNHFQPHFDPSRASIAERLRSFDNLFELFSRQQLRGEGGRHVQFVLFYYAQTAPELSERFVKLLNDILTDPNADTMQRRSASAYVASFIARGAHIPRDLVRSTFETVAYEMEKLRKSHELNERIGPDLNRFAAYYTSFQCLMYIFCFRWRDLVEDEVDEDNFDAHDLKFDSKYIEPFRRNVACRLNPLKVCATSIVLQFRDVTRQLEVLYVDHIIEQNKRIRLTRSMAMAVGSFSIIGETERNSKNLGESHFQLSGYFPFDGYRLPLTKALVEAQYNEYRSVPGFEPVDDEEEVA